MEKKLEELHLSSIIYENKTSFSQDIKKINATKLLKVMNKTEIDLFHK